MRIESIQSVKQVRHQLDGRRRGGETIGLIPTMGALHDGHGKLIERARTECDVVVVSVFVNPLQFGPSEDLDSYPKDLGADLLFCEVRGVDLVFAPTEQEIYPVPQRMFVEVGPEGKELCGGQRAGHFRGVATVVLKLFNIVGPHRAYFGEKDFQQLTILRRMAVDFALPVEIVAVETQREHGGLAISSRNRYLDAEERLAAGVLYRALRMARRRIGDGDTDSSVVKDAAMTVLDLEPLVRVEYVEIVDPLEMEPVHSIVDPVRAMGAVWIGNTRLIDNILCEPFTKKRNA